MGIDIHLPDKSSRTLNEGATGADLAADISTSLAKKALAIKKNGVQIDLDVELENGDAIEIITDDTEEGLEIIRHSTAHVLAQAVLTLYPEATFAIGPPIENGFYYDFELPDGKSFSDDDLAAISSKMAEIVKADQKFVRNETDSKKALKLFSKHPYKCEIIETVSNPSPINSDGAAKSGDLASEMTSGDAITYYTNGDNFFDLCRGPHVPSTGRLKHFALEKVAGAYWRGDEKRSMLQRIYGTAWNSAKSLKQYLVQLEEAAKRDHRKLARELDLLSWPESLGPGLAVWHPKGALIRNIIEQYSRDRHIAAGYDQVYSPHIAKSELWQTSGHLDFYSESMYPAMELDGASYYPKPMNCPFHVLTFSSSQKSYRQLPLRLFELGTVYRYELSGAVHGLMRGRGFTQDDSHIFCTQEQMGAEIFALLDFSLSVLRDFGFDQFQTKLSTRPFEKSVGEDSLWELATTGLKDALEKAEQDYTVDEGGGAFYGPKIDIDVKDAIGRSWQLSTIQVDFNLPERFDLTYTGEDSQRHRPVMIHRALMGSIDRFFGVLIEHYSGAFPLWLAPEQVRVLPVAEAHQDYGQKVADEISAAGFRVLLDSSDQPLGKRIRSAKVLKLPYILVVGDEDIAANTVGVNERSTENEKSEVKRGIVLTDFISELKKEAKLDANTDIDTDIDTQKGGAKK